MGFKWECAQLLQAKIVSNWCKSYKDFKNQFDQEKVFLFRFCNMMDPRDNWMPMHRPFYQSTQITKAEIFWTNCCQWIPQLPPLFLPGKSWLVLASTRDPLNLKGNLTSKTKLSSETRIPEKVINLEPFRKKPVLIMTVSVMGVKGRRVHMIEEMSDTIISFQRG